MSVTGTAQPNVGVYKTTDGGATWSLVWDAQTAGSVRGVTDVEIDPLDHTTVYAAAFQLGIVRSIAGGTFRQIFAGQVPTVNVDRTELAVTVKDGKTRIYATNGSQGPASVCRSRPSTAPTMRRRWPREARTRRCGRSSRPA